MTQDSLTWDQVIKARFSCRTYAETPLQPDEISTLESICKTYTRGCFGETLRFTVYDAQTFNSAHLGDYLRLITNYRYFLVGTVSSSPMYYEAYAYALEKIVLEITRMGVNSCWLGTFNPDFFSRLVLAPNEIRPAVVVLGRAAETPTTKDKVARISVRAHRRKPWDQLFFRGSFTQPLLAAEAGDLQEALEWVRLGPSAGNMQSWRIVKDPSRNIFHFFKVAAKEDYDRRGMHRLDTGIAMRHFALGAQVHGLKGTWQNLDPQLDAVPEKTDYRISWVQKD